MSARSTCVPSRRPRISVTDANAFCESQRSRPSMSAVMWSGPWRNNADAVATTSAPASRNFTTSTWLSTPVPAARDKFDAPRQQCYPSERQMDIGGRRQRSFAFEAQRLQIEIGPEEAIEQHHPIGADRFELSNKIASGAE